ncbi:MAG TPA: hypothetical protein VGD66_04745 [Allosphingosinicella sp.]
MTRAAAAIFIFLLGQAAAAAAEPVSADAAMQRYRQVFQPPATRCAPGKDEITVCGQRPGPDPNRLPLPVQPLPGSRVAGEAPDQVAASELGNERCTTVGRDTPCTGTVPIIPIAIWIVKTAIKAARGDD